MVEKKNLATLIAAYAKFCDGWREPESAEMALRQTSDEGGRQAPVALVFVGSGELEGALREQARSLGLRVVDRTDWKAELSGHGLTRMEEDKSERLAADRTGETANSRVTPAVGHCPTEQTDDCKLTTDVSAAQRGAVFFYGFRQIEENPVFYALAEAFVLPSLKEEWGLVVNEAMACSLPVIVSRTAGCAEDLLPGSEQVPRTGVCGDGSPRRPTGCRVAGKDTAVAKEADVRAARPYLEQRSNGFVFDPRSSDALCEALRRIADQETKRLKGQETDGITEMGRCSREIVAKFSCGNFAQQALRAAEVAGA